jgi:hypothetical protein
MLVLRHTDPVTRVMAHTDPVTVQGMPLTQVPSRSRLAIDRIILAVRVITWATLITYGGRDIGDGAADKESGYTGITS